MILERNETSEKRDFLDISIFLTQNMTKHEKEFPNFSEKLTTVFTNVGFTDKNPYLG